MRITEDILRALAAIGGLTLLAGCTDVRGVDAPPVPPAPPATVSCPVEPTVEAPPPQPQQPAQAPLPQPECVLPLMDPCPPCGRG